MRALKYELKNLMGNPATVLFGLLMPLAMGAILPNTVLNDLPEGMRDLIGTSIILSISLIIPMAISLIGYAAIYANEVEKDIPKRLALFGISDVELFKGKVLSQMILVIVSSLIYFGFMSLVSKHFDGPSAVGVLRYTLIMLLLCFIYVGIAHGVSKLTGKFGTAYGITMALYFLFMFLGGMMGPRYENFSPIVKRIADLFPTSIFGKESYTIWTKAAYNWGPMIQSFLFLGAVSLILLVLSIRKDNKRRL